MADTNFKPAPEIQKIAEELIRKYHTGFENIRIEYVWRIKHMMSKGEPVLGRALVKKGIDAYLATAARKKQDIGVLEVEDFFILEIAEDLWEYLDDTQRKALVDHQLCHMTWEANEKGGDKILSIADHDVGEFNSVVDRFGLHNRDVRKFLRALNDGAQLSIDIDALSLPDDEEEPEPEAGGDEPQAAAN